MFANIDLYGAIECNDLDGVHRAIANGAEVDIITPGSNTRPLFKAISSGCYDIALVLLDHGASVWIFDADGGNPLHWSLHSPALTRRLLDAGLQPGPAARGKTPLHTMALKGGHRECPQILIDAGVDIHARDNRGDTALKLCLSQGAPDTIMMLLDAGAAIPAEAPLKQMNVKSECMAAVRSWQARQAIVSAMSSPPLCPERRSHG